MKPLAIDLFCGLGGWTEGLLAEGYRVVGFDLERHVYGEHQYPAQLVLQDVLTIHGRQFKTADLIVASPPCQEFSYMAMPWTLAKQKIRDYESGRRDVQQLTALFDACFRIQREASEAKGQYIPLVVENVRGAQRWVGRARWNFGSFYLWGDVPALMPMTKKAIKGHGGAWFKDADTADGTYGPGNFRIGVDRSAEEDLVMTGDGPVIFNCAGELSADGLKNSGGSWFNIGSPGQKETGRNPVHELAGVKVATDGVGRRTDVGKGARFTSRDCDRQKNGGDWFSSGEECSLQRRAGSKSPARPARKAASAMIAKIPLVLARHIGKAWYPERAA